MLPLELGRIPENFGQNRYIANIISLTGNGAFFEGEYETLKFLRLIKIKNSGRESAREKKIARALFFNSLVADWMTFLMHIDASQLPETYFLQVSLA
jgi:hypothetical protein